MSVLPACRPTNLVVPMLEGALWACGLRRARRPAWIDRTAAGILVSLSTSFFWPVVGAFWPARPGLGGAMLYWAGFFLSVYGLTQLAVRGSLGLLPALREPVRDGLYRFLRHPVYTGYALMMAGYGLGVKKSGFWLGYLIWLGLTIWRARREEAVLLGDRVDPRGRGGRGGFSFQR